MTKVVYYLFLKPLSKLPLRGLYLLSNFLYFIIFKIVGYRKAVVYKNITNSFPEKSNEEINLIAKKFYQHFADLIVESIKIFSISKKEAIARCTLINPDVLNNLYDKGKHVILVGGHYNNWEMLAVILNTQVKHQIAGIYSPLSNDFFNEEFSKSRIKFGLQLIAKREVASYFKKKHSKLTATVFGADQSPTFVNKNTYWTTFLNQDSPMMFGTEKYAVENDYPVVFIGINKTKRGHYQMNLTLLEENPVISEYCSITEKHTRMLEKQIVEQPEFYLWTHKRWKHKKPV